MSKNKKLGLGIAAVAAGAGLAYATNKSNKQKIKKIAKAEPPIDYRNTERGKYEKNSKGIYIPMETTRHLPDQRSRKESMTRVHILSVADLQHWQRHVFL